VLLHAFERSRLGKTRSKSESLARIGVADGGHEEAQAKGQHDDVQHGILPVAPA
jgi:hypothetical protein